MRGHHRSSSFPAIMIAGALAIVPTAARAQTLLTTKEFGWLVGRWEGATTGRPGRADVAFSPAVAGLMTGVMRLVIDEKIAVVELISLVDTPGGPELRFRHFSPLLDAYEDTFKQALRLTRHTADAYVFENAVPYDKALMSTQPRVTTFQRIDADTFVGRSDIINNNGEPAVVEVRYRRVANGG